MGQRQNQSDIVYGNRCGFISPPEKTPKYIYVRFSKVVRCTYYPEPVFVTPPNDRVFKLTQDPDYACVWDGISGDWDLVLDMQWSPPNAILWLTHIPTRRVYFYGFADTPLVEGFVFHNILDDCPGGDAAAGGIAVVTWKLQPLKVMGSLGIKTAKDLFMEMRPLEDGNLVYKFCRLKDATNIAILYEP